MKKLLIFASLLFAGQIQAQVVINEIMQSNIDCIMDELNDFPDSWVELYNSGADSVNLANMKLGLSNNAGEAWQLPSYALMPNEHVVIYCDKEEKNLHTHFRLDSGKGGSVYLFANNAVIDQVTGIAKQPAPNVAYGRKTDGSSQWGYQAVATPGQANCDSLIAGVLPAPEFSVLGQVVTVDNTTIDLTISIPSSAPQGTVLSYTTDGSEPTAENGIVSSSAVNIQFNESRVIRAKLLCAGHISPRSTTESYLFLGRQMTLPVFSIVSDNDYFYSDSIGILVTGTYNSETANYYYNWRRPINLEFFDTPDQPGQLNQLCETRVQGGASRGNAIKSLALYANKRFGTKRLQYEFFPDQRPGITEFKSISLRNSGNDFDYLYMRDALIQRSMAEYVDVDWQAWSPAIIFINGQYIGMLNIRERANEDNIYTNYNELEDIDLLENGALKAGTYTAWWQFTQFVQEHGHTWDEYAERMDLYEYINYTILELFYQNQDWPGNNSAWWRPTQDTPEVPQRWRWILKDTDFGLGIWGRDPDFNMFKWMYDPNYDPNNAWANTYDATRLFRRLMEIDLFRERWIDRAAIYIGDFLNLNRLNDIWVPMQQKIAYEYPYHRQGINPWWPNYSQCVQEASNWIAARPDNFLKHMRSQWDLGVLYPLKINNTLEEEDINHLSVSFNEVPLTRGSWDGKYFNGRNIRLKAELNDSTDRQVVGWHIKVYHSTYIDEYDVTGDSCFVAIGNDVYKAFFTTTINVNSAVEDVEAKTPQNDKYFKDNTIYIDKKGKKYTVDGRKIE